MEKIRNAEIYEKFKAGISADEIAQTEGISRARVYQIINSMKAREKVADLPLIDDSPSVIALQEKIKELENELQKVRNENSKLTDIIFNLVQKK